MGENFLQTLGLSRLEFSPRARARLFRAIVLSRSVAAPTGPLV
jgi:hypothetical protein